jgi:hypothetical protein
MIRALLKNGRIVPAEPLPADWADGQELLVDRQPPPDDPADIDRWARQLDEAAASIPADDLKALERSLEEVERQSKESVRRLDQPFGPASRVNQRPIYGSCRGLLTVVSDDDELS